MTNNQLTREWLQGRIANMECYGVVGDEALILQVYRIALAAMDSEPVADDGIFRPGDAVGVFNVGCETCPDHLVAWTVKGRNLPAGSYWLYISQQPAPVVPVEMNSDKAWGELKISAEDCQAWSEGWNACRAAMLQDEPVTTANKLGNSPVIPDGWKLVPVEPNGDMLAAAQDAYGETDGDIASTLRAAIAAAPQREV